jgi:methylated-DNA-[protein]-cysteine S-methyltransferase
MHKVRARKIISSPVGWLAVAGSEKGVCSIDFLSAGSKLKDFGESELARNHVESACEDLERYFTGKLKCFLTALDLSGTRFQLQVWQQIAKIEFGHSTSYGAIAKAIRNPAAARAVGGAVGANPIPILIPCHRVMGSTGSITGYSGGKGIPTKKKLLALEGISFR